MRSPQITREKEDQERDVIATVTNYVRTKSDTTTKRKRDNMTLFRSREIFTHTKSPQVTSSYPLFTLLGMREFPHTIQSRSSLKPRNLSIIERMIQFLHVSFSLLVVGGGSTVSQGFPLLGWTRKVKGTPSLKSSRPTISTLSSGLILS